MSGSAENDPVTGTTARKTRSILMNADLLEITARKRRDPFAVADPSDFEFNVGPSIDPQLVLSNPLISLYCLDHANRRALFVETAPSVDLSQAPFLYQAQYENAVRLIGVPYETLHDLARGISFDDQKLILVYSVGRTGSTLLGASLNAVEGMVGLSEPDVFTQLVTYREWDGSNEAEISALVESCTKLLCKPTEQTPNPQGWAIKFRSFAIELGDLLYKHFPDTRNIFLYRSAEPWLNSMLRAFGEAGEDVGFRSWAQGWLSTLVPPITEHVQAGGPLLTLSSLCSMLWLNVLERFTNLQNSGMPSLAVRYEDMQAAPHETLQKIFAYCGLPTSSMEAVYQVLEKDSQAGSGVSQEAIGHKKSGLTESQRADLFRELQAHPFIQSSDFVVQGTWMPTVGVR
jgi:hypothetical protein